MSEKYKVILKLNLPPVAQYQQGHSLIVQGDSVGELTELLAGVIVGPGKETTVEAHDRAGFILQQFIEEGQKSGVAVALDATETPQSTEMPRPPAAPAAKADGKASQALLIAAAKKKGVKVEELGELTTEEARKIIKGES